MAVQTHAGMVAPWRQAHVTPRAIGQALRRNRTAESASPSAIQGAGSFFQPAPVEEALAVLLWTLQNHSPLQKPSTTSPESLSGLIERVTFFNEENGFGVLQVKAKGHRNLVTVVGHLTVRQSRRMAYCQRPMGPGSGVYWGPAEATESQFRAFVEVSPRLSRSADHDRHVAIYSTPFKRCSN